MVSIYTGMRHPEFLYSTIQKFMKIFFCKNISIYSHIRFDYLSL